MTRNKSHNLRTPVKEIGRKRSRSQSLPRTGTKEYERNKKRAQRARSLENSGSTKRGRRETVSIKNMSVDEN